MLKLTGSAGLVMGLVLLNLITWAVAWRMFVGEPTMLGTALLAWVFGLRHAVDVDHIAAIDNVVRKLMQEGRRPLSAGLWFSLGHSTIVVLLCVAIATSAAAMYGSQVIARQIGSVAGTLISASFLLGIGLLNLMTVRSIWRVYNAAQTGSMLDAGAVAGGLLQRITAPLCRIITRSWHMYPLGLLFGLGFDTATEIALLSISATQAGHGVSPWRAMIFPALFTAGMALVDTTDSIVMVRTYGSAFVNPLRRLQYNLTVTTASVMVALLVGGVEVLALVADRLDMRGAFWNLMRAIDSRSDLMGFVVVCLFLLCWLASALASRRRKQAVLF